MAILVIAQLDGDNIAHSTRSVISAAIEIGGQIDVLVAGSSDAANIASKLSSVNKVLYVCDTAYEHNLAENLTALIKPIAGDYSHILAPATTFGKDFMPRLAAILDVAQISEITEIIDANNFLRPIYAGNAIATITSNQPLNIITVRPSAFDKVADGGNADIQEISPQGDSGLSSFVSQEITKSDRPDLTAADIVVSGGRGVGSKENFAIIQQLADKLGGAVGASRAAVDNGYVSNDLQVGQTGKIIAPQLYIAAGISGAIQHIAGMKNSKIIVAINKDENAPIFEVADYGLVADLFEAIPEIIDSV